MLRFRSLPQLLTSDYYTPARLGYASVSKYKALVTGETMATYHRNTTMHDSDDSPREHSGLKALESLGYILDLFLHIYCGSSEPRSSMALELVVSLLKCAACLVALSVELEAAASVGVALSAARKVAFSPWNPLVAVTGAELAQAKSPLTHRYPLEVSIQFLSRIFGGSQRPHRSFEAFQERLRCRRELARHPLVGSELLDVNICSCMS